MTLNHPPSGWTINSLGEFADIVRGSSPRPAGDPRYFNGSHLPWITVADVTSLSGMYLSSTTSKLTELGAKHTRVLPRNTVILTNSGATLGVPAITDIVAGANDGIAAFLNLRHVHPEFLCYVLQSLTKHFRECLAPGVGQPNLNTELIANVTGAFPPAKEQARIVEVLRVWDTAISNARDFVRAKTTRLTVLRQQLLSGRRRFPKFAHSAFVPSRLGDLAAESRQRNGNRLGIGSVFSVTNNRGMIPMPTSVASDDLTRYKLVNPNRFAYNPMRLNVGSIARWQGDNPVLVSPDYVVFECGPQLDPRYLDELRRTHLWRQFVGRSGDGSVRIRIYFDDLARLKLSVPSIEEQRQIALFLGKADEEIVLLDRYATCLAEQKRGLMQQLLTGKIRVPICAPIAEAVS